MDKAGSALLVTVGTGTAEEFEATMKAPFGKSFRRGNWSAIVLLASKRSLPEAERLKTEHGELPIRVTPLSKPGDEENLDRCYEQFERAISRVIEEGFAPERITADFTRGTKAMSAALALAGVRHGVRQLRYIGATRRDNRGMAVPGHEVVSDVEPASISEGRDFERGIDFLRSGEFGAVGRLFPGFPKIRWAGPRGGDIRWLQWTAEFWGAWDALDYGAARDLPQMGQMPAKQPGWMQEFLPGCDQAEMVTRLAGQEPGRRKLNDRAPACRDLAADLIENSARRMAAGQTEEALVRAYRLLELLGQTRLFAHGIDSAKAGPEDSRVAAWLEGLRESERPKASRQHEGQYELGRELAAKLLAHLGDPLAPKLLDLKWLGELGPHQRNNSILIHGFRARSRRKDGLMRPLLERIREFYLKEDAGNAARLEACRFRFLR